MTPGKKQIKKNKGERLNWVIASTVKSVSLDELKISGRIIENKENYENRNGTESKKTLLVP